MINHNTQSSTKSIYTRGRWTTEEDQVITKLFYQKIKKPKGQKKTWEDISLEMNSELRSTKTGKMCRQRWLNQLRPGLSHQRIWTREEVQILFDKQYQLGTKWSKISPYLPGRTDNSAKNFFYSAVRKAIRVVNRYLKVFPQFFCKFRPLDLNFATKLIKYTNVDSRVANQYILKGKKIILDLKILEMQQIFSSNEQQIIKQSYKEFVKNIISQLRIFFLNHKKVYNPKIEKKNSESQVQEQNQSKGQEKQQFQEVEVKYQNDFDDHQYKVINSQRNLQNQVKIQYDSEMQRQNVASQHNCKEENQEKEQTLQKEEKVSRLKFNLMIP